MPNLPELKILYLKGNPISDPERIQAFKDRGGKVYT